MLSYIHSYHAGNHADILKHLTITLILESLCKKEKPFTVFDTHSGSGIYDLDDSRLLKTGEAASGIEKLISFIKKNKENDAENENLKNLLETGKKYLETAEKYYDEGKYPGSPLIENEMLRTGDEQILSELHPTAFEELEFCFYSRKKTQNLKIQPKIHKRDGYEMLKALTPPKIKRGLAVIDPSFEDASDYLKCSKTISEVHKKWPAGIIALWYPILTRKTFELENMKEAISANVDSTANEPKILDIQLEVKSPEETEGLSSMYGSGMFIVNFPYELDKKMEATLSALSEILGENKGNWSVNKI